MALSFNSPTPRRLRRPNRSNLFLLGFSTKTHSKLLFISSTVYAAIRARGRAGRAGQGAAGGRAGRAGHRAGQGRAGRQGRAGQGTGQGGRQRR